MIVGIIPARGGSKGAPLKNIRSLAGFPLIYWSIQAAKRSKRLDDFFVSTEDPEIAEVARHYGAKVLKRPRHLAQDDTTTFEVLMDALAGIPARTIVVLQPTSPLRDEGIIDQCLEDFFEGGHDTLATGYNTKILEYATHRNLRRQDIKGFFYDDGNVYILDRAVIESGRWFGDKILRKEIVGETNLEIDTETEFFLLDCLLRKRLAEGRQTCDLREALKNVKMLVMDVDGTLTDAAMYYSENGDELKRFDTRDGKGLELIRERGIKTAIITSEQTEIVAKRARKLKIDFLLQGVLDKGRAIEELSERAGLPLSSIAFVGDDLNDLPAMERVGLPIAVRGAAEAVRKSCQYETLQCGGHGAIREVCDLLVEALGDCGETSHVNILPRP